MNLNQIFYHVKPYIPRRVQIALRRAIARHKRKKYGDIWPIDKMAASPPGNWSGWPDGKKFAFILTHDVESKLGVEKCLQLADLEESLGFRSSFNFVINDYVVPKDLRDELVARGFEVGVHGYTHDGRYLQSERSFLKQYKKINEALVNWGAVGYRAPSMLGNLNWQHYLDITYDASTFDTDPFEPQPYGVQKIFPFWVENPTLNGNGFIELPYTLPQDSTLYLVMQETSQDIWKIKLDWIFEQSGMALLITHPDYMNFSGRNISDFEYSYNYYESFLEYVNQKYSNQYWHVLPKDISRHWKKNVLNIA